MLTFDMLRAANTARLPLYKNKRGERIYHKPDGTDWALSQWSNALAGEVGETCNLVKKIERGDFSLEGGLGDLAEELADVQCYLDLLALRAGIDLGKATTEKFNLVSAAQDCKVRLRPEQPLPPLTKIKSSNIAAVGDSLGRLYVHFNSGALWSYPDPEARCYAAMLGEGSAGSYFHKHVRTLDDAKQVV